MTAEVLFGKLAGFHSASWRDFIRQVGIKNYQACRSLFPLMTTWKSIPK